MTRDDIIRMAREASVGNEDRNIYFELVIEELEAFAALVAAAERESCAKLVEHFDGYSPRYGNHLTNCAAAIRNRGKE